MTQIQKYTWLIDTIRNTGEMSYKEISDRWERNVMYSDGNPLPQATFNRWREDIDEIFNIRISCRRSVGNLYYIENPEAMEADEVRKYILDSVSAGNLISENISLKDRIIIDRKPSGYNYLSDILTAMKDNRTVRLTYQSFEQAKPDSFAFEPYCVKLFYIIRDKHYIDGECITFSCDSYRGFLNRLDSMKKRGKMQLAGLLVYIESSSSDPVNEQKKRMGQLIEYLEIPKISNDLDVKTGIGQNTDIESGYLRMTIIAGYKK